MNSNEGSLELPTQFELLARSWNLADAPFRCFSLGNLDRDCQAKCPDRVSELVTYFRKYAGEREELQLDEFSLRFNDAKIAVDYFRRCPAILDIPATLEDYLKQIGDKSRNVIRKAERQGYVARLSESLPFLDDILQIRTSTPSRQGKELPAAFSRRPRQMIETEGFCSRHDERFYGVFLESRMVAYGSLTFYGELARMQHILGHAAHLSSGIMYLLVREMVNDLISHRPLVKGIIYLYPKGWTAGLDKFKQHVGFGARTTCVTAAPPEMARKIQDFLTPPQSPRMHGPADKGLKKKKISLSNFQILAEKLTLGSYISSISREITSALLLADKREVVPLSVRKLLHEGTLVRVDTIESVRKDAESEPVYSLIFCKSSDFMDVISGDLKLFSKKMQRRGILIAEFARKIDYPSSLATSDAETVVGRRIKYLRRFRSASPSTDDIGRAFRGSDFGFLGIVEPDADAGGSVDCWLVLQKVC